VLKSVKRDLSSKTIEELRAMLRAPVCLSPNTVLLELGRRGHDLEVDLPVVLDMLVSPSRDKRIRGWHALASAFPKQAKVISDYRVDDSLDQLQSKIQRLRVVKDASAKD
jgi:hypothetical protein